MTEKTNTRLWMLSTVIWAISGFLWGYHYPRPEEVESTKPIEIRYEVTPEAARYLVLKAIKGVPQ